MNKISHSSASRFQTCPKSYEYHYVKRYRPKLQSAALLFGTAVDRAVTALMNQQITKEEKNPEDIFAYTWRFQEVNGHNTYLPTSTDIVYANSDYDEELLTEEDISKLKGKYKIEDPVAEVKAIYERKDLVGFDQLPDADKILLNHSNWLSLFHKGLLMVEAVRTKILPNITEVLDTQAYVTLENDDGDRIVGYADLVCRWKGYEKPIVLDFKTSSRDYAKDAVLTSPQLTLYVHSLFEKYGTRSAGFVVLKKHVRKNRVKICSTCRNDGTGKRHKTCDAEASDGSRCNGDWIVSLNPEIIVDILIDEIPVRTEDIVLENLAQVNTAIKNGNFVRNFGSCHAPWGKCEFFNLCYKDSMEGLIDMEKKNES